MLDENRTKISTPLNHFYTPSPSESQPLLTHGYLKKYN